MKRPRLELLVFERDDGSEVLAAPTTGAVRFKPRAGETLVEGSVAGSLVRGEVVFDLVLPAGVRGQIREVLAPQPVARGEYRLPLAVLGAVEAAPLGTLAKDDVSDRLWDVRAPSHGTFYRRPGPDAPAYIEAGHELQRGATLGLVEVMKCFSPILFDPPAGRERGRVRDVLVQDGQEIRSDQVLARIELI